MPIRITRPTSGSPAPPRRPIHIKPRAPFLEDPKAGLSQIDMLIVMDCTGSMGPIIGETRKRLSEMARALVEVRPDIRFRFGFVGYRDHGDPDVLPYAAPMGESIEKTLAVLEGTKADGGGDAPEAVLDGLQYACKSVEWSKPAQKVLVLAGDAPMHDPCKCGLTSRAVVDELRKAGIVVYCIGASSSGEMHRQFAGLAEETGGLFVPLSDHTRLLHTVLGLVRTEVRALDRDLAIYDLIRAHPEWPLDRLAEHLGCSRRDVEAALDRLRTKGALGGH